MSLHQTPALKVAEDVKFIADEVNLIVGLVSQAARNLMVQFVWYHSITSKVYYAFIPPKEKDDKSPPAVGPNNLNAPTPKSIHFIEDKAPKADPVPYAAIIAPPDFISVINITHFESPSPSLVNEGRIIYEVTFPDFQHDVGWIDDDIGKPAIVPADTAWFNRPPITSLTKPKFIIMRNWIMFNFQTTGAIELSYRSGFPFVSVNEATGQPTWMGLLSGFGSPEIDRAAICVDNELVILAVTILWKQRFGQDHSSDSAMYQGRIAQLIQEGVIGVKPSIYGGSLNGFSATQQQSGQQQPPTKGPAPR